MIDLSNGYDAIAEEFIRVRGSAGEIGVSVVREWASALPRRASVLDVGCGSGVPVSQALVDRGLKVYGVDASPKMIAAFRKHFPDAEAECNAVQASSFFNRTFDAAIAWGLIFLLDSDSQKRLIRKIADVLVPGGRFLFTAPQEAVEWRDILTGRMSLSFGAESYRQTLEYEGLQLIGESTDEGENHYYSAYKSVMRMEA